MRAGRHRVEVTHPEKVIFPRDGLTKLDVATYYADIAPVMLPKVRDRPLILRRYVEGIDDRPFVQQDFRDRGPP